MNPSIDLGLQKINNGGETFGCRSADGERSPGFKNSNQFLRFGLSQILGLLLVSFCAIRAEAFRYWQEITVSKPGLVQARLPFETMEKAQCREEIRLFNEEGEEMPLVIQGLELGGNPFSDVRAESKYRILGDHSILTFSIVGEEMDGFDLSAWGKSSEKMFTIERSGDGETWQKLYEGLFSHRFMVGFPATKKRHFRVTFSDTTTPPLTDVRVQLRRATNKGALELMPVSYTATSGSPLGLRLVIRPPLRHVVVEGFEIESPDLGKIITDRLKGGSHHESTGEDWIPPEGQYSIAEIYCPDQTPPFLLAHWGGYAHDGSQWLGFIPTRTGTAVKISAMRARVRPYSLSFQANKPGKYILRFGTDGPATDPVLVYGQRQSDLQERVRRSTEFIPATAGPVMVHGSVAQAQSSPGWDPLPNPLDTRGFSGRYSVKVEKEGFQSAAVPAKIFGQSDLNGNDWRLSSNGKELPFQIRTDSAEVGGIPFQYRLLQRTGTLSRWELTGPFTGVSGIYLQSSVRGPFKTRSARITENNRTLGEGTWAQDPTATSRAAKAKVPFKEWPHLLRLHLQMVPTQDTLLLEVEDGENRPLNIDAPSMYHRQKVLVFKAKPTDSIEFFFGRQKLEAPVYAIRTDPKASVTVTEFKAYIDLSSPLKGDGENNFGRGISSLLENEVKEPTSSGLPLDNKKRNEPSPKKYVAFIFWIFLGFILMALILIIISDVKKKKF